MRRKNYDPAPVFTVGDCRVFRRRGHRAAGTPLYYVGRAQDDKILREFPRKHQAVVYAIDHSDQRERL